MPVYCTIMPCLVRQVEDYILGICGCKFEVILPKDLNKYIDKQDILIIFDEFYDELKRADIVLNVRNQLPGVFKVGDQGKLIISTGHISNHFKKFL